MSIIKMTRGSNKGVTLPPSIWKLTQTFRCSQRHSVPHLDVAVEDPGQMVGWLGSSQVCSAGEFDIHLWLGSWVFALCISISEYLHVA